MMKEDYENRIKNQNETFFKREASMIDAPSILRTAAQTISARAASRDLATERSMRRAVSAFNTLTGQSLSETQGWLFMAVLKLARATAGKHNNDDLLDAAAYVALTLEAEMQSQEDKVDFDNVLE